MLQRLSIRNIVLIDTLDLDFSAGLTAMTGETGAGKSILLDALSLALGERSDAGLIRAGQDSASVTAEFHLSDKVTLAELYEELGLPESESFILRRTLARDGKSRAFLNDQPVSVGALKTLAARLIEVEGQFGVHALLERDRHRALLDRFGGLDAQRAELGTVWRSWRAALQQVETLQQNAEASAREEAWLRASTDELRQLAPQEGEEDELVTRRARLQQQQKLLDGLQHSWSALSGDNGVEMRLSDASRALQKLCELLPESAPSAIAALDRAAFEVADAVRLIELEQQREGGNGLSLDEVEDRLYKLRAAARKFQVATIALPGLASEFEGKLALIDNGSQLLNDARLAVQKQQTAYAALAEKLSAARRKTAMEFDKLVAAELAPLKLDKAIFTTDIAPLDMAQAQENGLDQITFTIAMNPGSAATPIHKTASGGELARLLLALKVVLKKANPVATLIFDEADTGLGGATAMAVGERLSRLAADLQVIVITHSPQVAAQANAQLKIAKNEAKGSIATTVVPLDMDERREEIARMLAGSQVTAAARAAADDLLAHGQSAGKPKPKKKTA